MFEILICNSNKKQPLFNRQLVTYPARRATPIRQSPQITAVPELTTLPLHFCHCRDSLLLLLYYSASQANRKINTIEP